MNENFFIIAVRRKVNPLILACFPGVSACFTIVFDNVFLWKECNNLSPILAELKGLKINDVSACPQGKKVLKKQDIVALASCMALINLYTKCRFILSVVKIFFMA